MGLQDPLHGQQACPEFIPFHKGVGQICPRVGLTLCRSLPKRGQFCDIPHTLNRRTTQPRHQREEPAHQQRHQQYQRQEPQQQYQRYQPRHQLQQSAQHLGGCGPSRVCFRFGQHRHFLSECRAVPPPPNTRFPNPYAGAQAVTYTYSEDYADFGSVSPSPSQSAPAPLDPHGLPVPSESSSSFSPTRPP